MLSEPIHQYDTIPDSTLDPLHRYDTIPIYTKGEPEGISKHSWYHGNITKDQAEAALRLSDDNGFLVRVSGDNLVLSKRHTGGWRSHDIIHRSPRGYRLEEKVEWFQSVLDMISYYQHHPIDGTQVLGTPIITVPSS